MIIASGHTETVDHYALAFRRRLQYLRLAE